MIKVNLLDSVTDRAKGVAAVEEKVANPRTQTMLFALVVFGMLAAGMLYDYYSTTSKRDEELKQVVGDPKAVSFGSQIRSYVLDDRRVKDHRTNHETHNVEAVLDRGELDEFIDAELRRKKAAKK